MRFGIADQDTWNGYHGDRSKLDRRGSYTLRFMGRVLINDRKVD